MGKKTKKKHKRARICTCGLITIRTPCARCAAAEAIRKAAQ